MVMASAAKARACTGACSSREANQAPARARGEPEHEDTGREGTTRAGRETAHHESLGEAAGDRSARETRARDPAAVAIAVVARRWQQGGRTSPAAAPSPPREPPGITAIGWPAPHAKHLRRDRIVRSHRDGVSAARGASAAQPWRPEAAHRDDEQACPAGAERMTNTSRGTSTAAPRMPPRYTYGARRACIPPACASQITARAPYRPPASAAREGRRRGAGEHAIRRQHGDGNPDPGGIGARSLVAPVAHAPRLGARGTRRPASKRRRGRFGASSRSRGALQGRTAARVSSRSAVCRRRAC